jgi:hypothetical protein
VTPQVGGPEGARLDRVPAKIATGPSSRGGRQEIAGQVLSVRPTDDRIVRIAPIVWLVLRGPRTVVLLRVDRRTGSPPHRHVATVDLPTNNVRGRARVPLPIVQPGNRIGRRWIVRPGVRPIGRFRTGRVVNRPSVRLWRVRKVLGNVAGSDAVKAVMTVPAKAGPLRAVTTGPPKAGPPTTGPRTNGPPTGGPRRIVAPDALHATVIVRTAGDRSTTDPVVIVRRGATGRQDSSGGSEPRVLQDLRRARLGRQTGRSLIAPLAPATGRRAGRTRAATQVVASSIVVRALTTGRDPTVPRARKDSVPGPSVRPVKVSAPRTVAPLVNVTVPVQSGIDGLPVTVIGALRTVVRHVPVSAATIAQGPPTVPPARVTVRRPTRGDRATANVRPTAMTVTSRVPARARGRPRSAPTSAAI